ncbi:SurA N-terminal domain-containing protein [bacterium]|nr:SurA N-terminal domain-containing protein [bacterium]
MVNFVIRLKITAVLFLLMSFFSNDYALAEQNKIIPKDEIVAEVNGQPITRQDLDKAVDGLKNMIKMANQTQAREMPEIPLEYLINQALDTIISFNLIYQKAAELGINVSPEEFDNEVENIKKGMSLKKLKKNMAGFTEESFRNSVLSSLYVKKLMRQVMPKDIEKVNADEIKQYYEQVKSTLQRNYDMVRIAHIFFQVPDKASDEKKEAIRKKALEVKKMLDEGADWEKMVIKYSDGITDYAKLGEFVPAQSFQKQIVKGELPAKVGGISEVLEAKDGFVIVKLTDRKAKGGYLTLDEASGTIEQMLESKKASEYVDKYIHGLRSAADVKIYIKQHGR